MGPGIKEFEAHSNKLVFEFDNKEAANHFKLWLCDMGEQDYWDWMERTEEHRKGDITGLNFNYHTGTDVIEVKCGRLGREK